METITDQAGFDAVVALPRALLLKHGARCPISSNARDEVGTFMRDHPDVPVYALEVVQHGALARHIASALGVRHESPQLFLLRDGRPAWHMEHYDISAHAIASRVDD